MDNEMKGKTKGRRLEARVGEKGGGQGGGGEGPAQQGRLLHVYRSQAVWLFVFHPFPMHCGLHFPTVQTPSHL
eukprot:757964-Rhodomonas_salina.2